MLEFVFTIDYEIYGSGEGSLSRLVYEPTERLAEIFNKRKARFAIFPDVAELEMIETHRADPSIELIKKQLTNLWKDGYEIGLHIHPWWYNAQREKGRWFLDLSEYNLCALPLWRIKDIVDRAMAYLRELLGSPEFTPFSFRAGHLLFQPTQPLGDVLADRGIRLDSSVYKGGLWRQHGQDYRRAPKNAYFWKFKEDVSAPDALGVLLEVPIFTYQAPIWKLFSNKRVRLQKSGVPVRQASKKVISRISDLMRFRYPMKFDLGQMTRNELSEMLKRIIRKEQKSNSAFWPIVSIMHSKDPIDFEMVDSLLDFLNNKRIKISTLADIGAKIEAIRTNAYV